MQVHEWEKQRPVTFLDEQYVKDFLRATPDTIKSSPSIVI